MNKELIKEKLDALECDIRNFEDDDAQNNLNALKEAILGDKDERYFIISVQGINGHATFPLSVNGYPSMEAITIIAEAAGLRNTAIMNIIELSKNDYTDFNKEELK